MNQLAIPVGELLRDVGISRTLETEGDRWLEQAIAALRRFVTDPAWREFALEDFRAWYVGEGYPQPHSHKVWGGFTTRAARRGVIVATGRYRRAVSPATHAHPVQIWRAA